MGNASTLPRFVNAAFLILAPGATALGPQTFRKMFSHIDSGSMRDVISYPLPSTSDSLPEPSQESYEEELGEKKPIRRVWSPTCIFPEKDRVQ